MDFREAVERLSDCPTRDELAQALGVSFFTVKQALLPEGSSGRRNAPVGWEPILAAIARSRAERLRRLAADLDP